MVAGGVVDVVGVIGVVGVVGAGGFVAGVVLAGGFAVVAVVGGVIAELPGAVMFVDGVVAGDVACAAGTEIAGAPAIEAPVDGVCSDVAAPAQPPPKPINQSALKLLLCAVMKCNL